MCWAKDPAISFHNKFSIYLFFRQQWNIFTLKPCKSCAKVDRFKSCMMMRRPPVVHITICLASGDSLHRIKPDAWNTLWYTKLYSVYELISHVNILPSRQDVTNNLSLTENSMFLTHLEWPRRERIFFLRLRISHSAIVVSSEHVANIRPSKNLGIRVEITMCMWSK